MDNDVEVSQTGMTEQELEARALALHDKYGVPVGEARMYLYMDETRAEEACKLAEMGYRIYQIKSALLFSGRELHPNADSMAGWIQYQKLIRHSTPLPTGINNGSK